MKSGTHSLGIVGVIGLLHAPSFVRPLLDSDEAVYASVAALVEAGGRIYAEGGVDNKFPGIYWTYAALFHVFGRYAMSAVHAATLVVVLLTALVLARITMRLRGGRAPWLSALLYGVLTTFYYPKMLAANTEIFMMLPLSLSVLLCLPTEQAPRLRGTRLFAAGMLIAVATLYRQIALLNLILTCGVPLLLKDRLPRRVFGAVCGGLGFAAVFALVMGSFAVRGNLDDFLFWTVEAVTLRYVPSGWGYHWPLFGLLTMLGVMIVPSALTAARLRRLRTFSTPERVLWLWLGVSTLAILVLWRFHPHYVIHVLGALAVLSAIEIDQILDERTDPIRRRFIRTVSGLLTTAAVIFAVVAVVLDPLGEGLGPPKPNYWRIAHFIRDATTEDQRVFVWGAYSALYVLSGRLPASRFVGFLRGCRRSKEARLEDCWDAGPRTWPLLAKDLAATPAELLVDTSSADIGDFGYYPLRRVPVLAELVAKKYALERRVEGVDIYRYQHAVVSLRR
jgi:hypothetical protein